MENENLKIQNSAAFGTDDYAVSKLLGGLNRVDAPNDFDFRVKARIASGKPTSKTASWFPIAIRYAVPLVLLLFVGGYFAFNTFYPARNDIPAVAVVQTNDAPVADAAPHETIVPASDQTIAVAGDERLSESGIKPSVKLPEKRISSGRLTTGTSGGGSYVEASNKGRQILPRGFDLNVKAPLNPKEVDRNVQIPVKEILTLIGVNAEFAGAGWKAGSVVPNSIAERAGVKSGDVIDAVNEQPLTEKTAFGNRFNIKKLRVQRGGQSVLINLAH